MDVRGILGMVIKSQQRDEAEKIQNLKSVLSVPLQPGELILGTNWKIIRGRLLEVIQLVEKQEQNNVSECSESKLSVSLSCEKTQIIDKPVSASDGKHFGEVFPVQPVICKCDGADSGSCVLSVSFFGNKVQLTHLEGWTSARTVEIYLDGRYFETCVATVSFSTSKRFGGTFYHFNVSSNSVNAMNPPGKVELKLLSIKDPSLDAGCLAIAGIIIGALGRCETEKEKAKADTSAMNFGQLDKSTIPMLHRTVTLTADKLTERIVNLDNKVERLIVKLDILDHKLNSALSLKENSNEDVLSKLDIISNRLENLEIIGQNFNPSDTNPEHY